MNLICTHARYLVIGDIVKYPDTKEYFIVVKNDSKIRVKTISLKDGYTYYFHHEVCKVTKNTSPRKDK